VLELVRWDGKVRAGLPAGGRRLQWRARHPVGHVQYLLLLLCQQQLLLQDLLLQDLLLLQALLLLLLLLLLLHQRGTLLMVCKLLQDARELLTACEVPRCHLVKVGGRGISARGQQEGHSACMAVLGSLWGRMQRVRMTKE
jgi:hypothetical protein